MLTRCIMLSSFFNIFALRAWRHQMNLFSTQLTLLLTMSLFILYYINQKCTYIQEAPKIIPKCIGVVVFCMASLTFKILQLLPHAGQSDQHEVGGSCRVKIALTVIMKKLLVRFISNFDRSFYSWVLLKSKSRGF